MLTLCCVCVALVLRLCCACGAFVLRLRVYVDVVSFQLCECVFFVSRCFCGAFVLVSC